MQDQPAQGTTAGNQREFGQRTDAVLSEQLAGVVVERADVEVVHRHAAGLRRFFQVDQQRELFYIDAVRQAVGRVFRVERPPPDQPYSAPAFGFFGLFQQDDQHAVQVFRPRQVNQIGDQV